jgi:uncharacterized Zn finger protein (UPF0148 family)
MWNLPRGRRKQRAEEPQDAAAAQRRRRSSAVKRGTSEEDVKAIAESLSSRLIPTLGLDLIGLQPADIKDLVYSIVSSLAESRSSKLTEEAAMKRIVAMRDNVLKAVSASLLSRGQHLTREQLEFIVAYAPEMAGRAAPYLYREALRLKADDIIDSLRSLWSQYGNPTPVECPRCGFRAVTPDLTCAVCGAELSEGEIKKHIELEKVLESLATRLHPRLIEEIVSAGYVVLDDDVKPPSLAPKQGYALTLHLNRSERELLQRLLNSQGQAQRAGDQHLPSGPQVP